ncbi:Jag N-terminal domain-containing protein [bacterium]|nr:Jag N-terminal domain-containing protein [bacterium]MBU1959062.1 Jag N-terminal domain-containing protein [bacterium]
MKKIEAETLEEAYSKAARELACSVTEINYEIIQHPASGVMGLFKKNAIIIAVKKFVVQEEPKEEVVQKKVTKSNGSITVTPKKKVTEEVVQKPTTATMVSKNEESFQKVESVLQKQDEIIDNFFNDNAEKIKITPNLEKKAAVEVKQDVVNNFDDDRDSPKNRALSIEIEDKIKKLMDVACFEIDTVEVDVFNGIAHVFVDGEDAALLIGKEGYRYNALSYMLFNWINAHYNLYIKLEIAEFIQAQEEMIENYLKPIAEHIQEHGKGKTKPLDGILVQIALEKLRAMFPNKYIAIKTGKDGKKFIIINNFNSKKNS